jgi:hypothetical protein
MSEKHSKLEFEIAQPDHAVPDGPWLKVLDMNLHVHWIKMKNISRVELCP